MCDVDQKIEIYKVFVRTITAAENRRQQGATIYLGIIVAVFTTAGAVESMPRILPAIATLGTSIIWLATVKYFRQLARAKFAVIKKLESDFSFAAFEMEWQEFRPDPDRKCKIGLTHLEMITPVIIGVISVLYLVWILIP